MNFILMEEGSPPKYLGYKSGPKFNVKKSTIGLIISYDLVVARTRGWILWHVVNEIVLDAATQANPLFAKDEQGPSKAVHTVAKGLKFIAPSAQSRLKTTKAVPDLSSIYDLFYTYSSSNNPASGIQVTDIKGTSEEALRLQRVEMNQKFYVLFA
ncbi:hypothetical protein FQN53_008778 [Emmonsiellopsis sp. PD_33]|nr:hypothetical protein FQN53_008778 [Emmonsiellopsis sp. PD_33]